MQRLFVTGGAGFIGSAFLRLVLAGTAKLAAVVTFDALTYAGNLDKPGRSRPPPSSFCPRRHHRTGRPCLPGARAGNRSGSSIFAAESHVDRSIAAADVFLRTQLSSARKSCSMRPVKRKVGRFLQVSTDEVMGSLPEDETVFFTEASPFAPNSPYGPHPRRAAEHLVRGCPSHTFGLETLITRCGNNYGPRQIPGESSFLCCWPTPCAMSRFPWYGDGCNVRDWIYVDDHLPCSAERSAARPTGLGLQHWRAQSAPQYRPGRGGAELPGQALTR